MAEHKTLRVKPEVKNTTAYSEGRQAHRAGLNKSNNPHPVNSQAWFYWLHGWRAAARQAGRVAAWNGSACVPRAASCEDRRAA